MKSIKKILSKLTKPINNRINASLKKRIDKINLNINDELSKIIIHVDDIAGNIEDIRYKSDEAYDAVNDFDYDDMERGIRNNYNSICEIEETVSDNDSHIREIFTKLDHNNFVEEIESLRTYITTLNNDLRHLETVVNTNPDDAQKACDFLNSNILFLQNQVKENVNTELKKWSVITATQLKQSNTQT